MYGILCTQMVCRFSDKTNNSWEQRDNFVKHSGKYDLIAVDYEATVRTVNHTTCTVYYRSIHRIV